MEALRVTDPTRLGPYTLLGVLGEGGMGTVYLGYDASNRLAAVKTIAAHQATDLTYMRRFQQEANIAQRVQSEHVATLLATNTTTEPWWYATEYIPGLTLQEAVRQAILPVSAVQKLAHGLILALRSIHQYGVIHRDLKPQNIILAQSGPHVIDFGIARAEGDAGLTTTGNVIGTVTYMSPEQLLGNQLSAASDIFALGGVLVYAATGHPPFDGAHSITVASAILSKEPDLSGVPLALRPLVEACLQKEESQRATLDDLRRLLPGTPTELDVQSSWWLPPVVRASIDTITSTNCVAKLVEPKPVYAPAPVSTRTADRHSARSTALSKRRAKQRLAGLLASMALIVVAMPHVPRVIDWFNDTEGPVDSAPSTPGGRPSDSPTQQPEDKRPLNLPSLSVGELPGKSYRPSSDAYTKVTQATLTGFKLTLTVEAVGYGREEKSVFSESCLHVGDRALHDPVMWKVTSTKSETSTGTIAFDVLEPGKLRFNAQCYLLDEVREVNVGSISLPGFKGHMNYGYQVPVMGSSRSGNKLTAVVPDYQKINESKTCLSFNGNPVLPRVERFTFSGIRFTELTYPATGGTLYRSCSATANKTTFDGKGVKLG